MQIQKRSFVKFMILNCLTLGIYGFITFKRIGEEINALCANDGDEPRYGYLGALLFAILPFGNIYLDYWWYRQTGRLQSNDYRYGLKVRESGTDTFLFRTAMQIPLAPFTAVLVGLAWVIPGLLVYLFMLMAPVLGLVFLVIFAIIFGIFGKELTAGAAYSFYFLFKNMNRYADKVQEGAYPADPMGYQYYPTFESKYPNYIPNLNNGELGVITNTYYKLDELTSKTEPVPPPEPMPPKPASSGGFVEGLKGSCAGYKFELKHGEEIVIGKDAKVSSIIIDPAFKQISRKHVGITYDANLDQYRVVDYSSNGTWANGDKMNPGQSTYLTHGTVLKLADDKNTFRLG